MKVQATCTIPAWDSGAAVLCYPGQVYEIERDGQLASLKDQMGKYVFEFDRAMPGSNADYTCDKCGKKFDSLNALGSHVHSSHSPEFKDGTEDEPVEKRPDGRKKPKTFTCHDCGKVSANLYHHRLHLNEHKKAPELVAE